MMQTTMKIMLAITIVVTAGVAVADDWKPVGDRIKTKWASKVTPENAWREYPRPQMVRKQWQNLNGLWDYKVTQADDQEVKSGKILVPYCIESSLSGVGHTLQEHETLWYERQFKVKKEGNRILLHFEAVDYECEAWVNGKSVGKHKGGNTPFTFDVTDAAVDGVNELKLKVKDATSGYQLTGKQVLKPGSIFYTRVSGIWQTVWLETVPATFIKRIKIDTDINPGTVKVKTLVGGDADKASQVRVTVTLKGKEVASAEGSLDETVLEIKDAKLWSPAEPNLYDLKVELLASGKAVDEVQSYAGIRTVGKTRDGDGHLRFTLNGKVIFHLGPLDQGWWPDGLLTPPSDEAILDDIHYLKNAGFNCIRHHIKVRPRRYYYHCDKIGMMIWQDQVSTRYKGPSWTRMKLNPQDGQWEEEAHNQFMYELREMMDYLHNAPSIAVWVPFNEAWGQHSTVEVGKWIATYDPSRLVNVASGGNFWPVGDVADHHSYPHPNFDTGNARYKDFIKVVGEFGGHGFVVDKKHLWNPKAKVWGYGGLPKTQGELLERYRLSIEKMKALKQAGVAGGIYTQTSDVEDEVNGLRTYDREVDKFPADILKAMHDALYAVPVRPAASE